jgi:hypothetical protein
MFAGENMKFLADTWMVALTAAPARADPAPDATALAASSDPNKAELKRTLLRSRTLLRA